MINLIYLLISIVCLNTSESINTRLTNFLGQFIDEHNVPGLTIAITMEDEIIYSHAFGIRNIDSGEPMKEIYFFHMASVSKPFVATAVMQLVEQGKMDLDENVTTYLPYFKLDDERYKDITIRSMLNHTSGMPDVEDYEWDKPQYDIGSAERYVRSLGNEKMLFTPGMGWRYSNMAFDVLGDVIAKVSGMPFEEYIKRHILDPLGMMKSSFIYPEIPQELRTTPHVLNEKPAVSKIYPYNRRHAPSSTLNSSVMEMTRWAIANIKHGELDGKRILKEKSYDVLWTNSVQNSDEARVGLSWFLGDYKGTTTINHGGGDTGYRSYITLLPEMKMAVIIASNYDRTPIGRIREGVLDIILDNRDQL